MLDSPASTDSTSDPVRGYFCAACKRRHEGRPFGSVGAALQYCEPAIAHLVNTGVIVKDQQSRGQQYGLAKRDR
jgi:hypothetical protein